MAFTGFSFAENKEIAIVKADVECNDITFDNELDSTFTGGTLTTGNYYLSEDVTVSDTITIPEGETVNFYLNGHVLISNILDTSKSLFVNKGYLGVYDDNTTEKHKFTVNETTKLATYDSTGLATGDNVVEITGGCITGWNTTNSTAGLVCSERYTSAAGIKLNGGTYIGNQANQGGHLVLYAYNNTYAEVENITIRNNLSDDNKYKKQSIRIDASGSDVNTNVSFNNVTFESNYINSTDTTYTRNASFIYMEKTSGATINLNGFDNMSFYRNKVEGANFSGMIKTNFDLEVNNFNASYNEFIFTESNSAAIFSLADNLSIKNSNITHNEVVANGLSLSGGLICVSGELTIDNTKIDYNTIKNTKKSCIIYGGIIEMSSAKDVSFTNNSSISYNTITSETINAKYLGTIFNYYSSDDRTLTFDATTKVEYNNISVYSYSSTETAMFWFSGTNNVIFKGKISNNNITLLNSFECCGGIFKGDSFEINGATISDNTLTYDKFVYGAIVYAHNGMTITNSTTKNNVITTTNNDCYDPSRGVLFYTYNVGITINNVEIKDNEIVIPTVTEGGLLCAENAGGTINITKLTCSGNKISSNSVDSGWKNKGMIIYGETITIDSLSLFDSNEFITQRIINGGLVYSTATITSAASFTNNKISSDQYNFPASNDDIAYGGIVYATTGLTITGGQYNNNAIAINNKIFGGIFYVNNDDVVVNISNVEINENVFTSADDIQEHVSTIEGIVINNNGTTNITSSSISENTITGDAAVSPGDYKGFIKSNIVVIKDSNITDNNLTAVNQTIYGGIIDANDVELNNVSLSGNTIRTSSSFYYDASLGGLIRATTLVCKNGTSISNNSLYLLSKCGSYAPQGGFIYTNNLIIEGTNLEIVGNRIETKADMAGCFMYLAALSTVNDYKIIFNNNDVISTGDSQIKGAFIYVNNSHGAEQKYYASTFNGLEITNNRVSTSLSDDYPSVEGFVHTGEGHIILNNPKFEYNTINVKTYNGLFIYTNGFVQITNGSFSYNDITSIYSNDVIHCLEFPNSYVWEYGPDRIEAEAKLINTKFNYNVITSKNNTFSFVTFNEFNCAKTTISYLEICNNTVDCDGSFNGLFINACGSTIDHFKFNDNTIVVGEAKGVVINNYLKTGNIDPITIDNMEVLNNEITGKGLIENWEEYVNFSLFYFTGADYYDSNLTITNSTISRNILNYGYYEENQLVYEDDTARGVIISAEDLTLRNVDIEDNIYTSKQGSKTLYGLVYVKGHASFKDLSIIDNSVIGSKLKGVLYILTVAEINYSYNLDNITIEGNENHASSAISYGVGLWIDKYSGYTCTSNFVLKRRVSILNNTSNYQEHNVYINYYKDEDEPIRFVVDETNPLRTGSYLSFIVYPEITNTTEFVFIENGKDYKKYFASELDNLYIKSNNSDTNLSISGRLISQPTKANPTYKIYTQDLLSDGVTVSYQWYKYVDGVSDITIIGQETNTYSSNKYIIANIYCICELSNGLTYKSNSISFAPSKISDPDSSNDYTFSVDKTNVVSTNSTIDYSWFKKIVTDEKVKPQLVDTTIGNELSHGTTLNFQGEEENVSSEFNSETNTWNRINDTTKSSSENDMFALTLELKAGQLLLVSSDAMYLAYEYLFKGDATAETNNAKIYSCTGDSDFISGYYYIDEDGTYTLLSYPCNMLTYEANVFSNYSIYVYDLPFTEFDNSRIVSYSTVNGDELANKEIISIYDSNTNKYSSTEENKPLGIKIHLEAGERLSLKASGADLYATYVYYRESEENPYNYSIYTTYGFNSGMTLFTTPQTGDYVFYIEGTNQSRDVKYPISIEVLSFEMAEADTSKFTTYETGIQTGIGGTYMYSVLDDDGYFVIPDEAKSSQNAIAGVSAQLEAGNQIVISSVLPCSTAVIYIFYSDTSEIEYKQSNIFTFVTGSTAIYTIPKTGYYGFLLYSDPEENVEGMKTGFKFYELASDKYEEVSCTSEKLSNEDSGDYYAVATYTQGTDTYKIKSKITNYQSRSITYKTNETVVGTLPISNKYTLNSNVTIASTNVYKEGYSTIGWSTVENATEVEYDFDEVITITNDLVLYPVFEEKADLDIDINIQEISIDDSENGFVLSGDAKNVEGIIVKYKVNGEWTTEVPTEKGTYDVKIERPEDNQYNAIEKEIANGLVIKGKYTITYSTSDTIIGTLPEDTNIYLEGTQVTIKKTTAAPNGYKAIGWSNVEHDDEVVYDFGQSVAISDNLVLYPVYVEKQDVALDDSTQEIAFNNTTNGFELNAAAKVAANKAGGYTIKYKVNGEWTTEVPTEKGTYDVKVEIPESEDYNAITKEIAGGLVIGKIKVNEPSLETNSFTYDGQEKTVVLVDLDSNLVADTNNVIKATNAGTYTIKYTLPNSDYEWAEGSDGIITWTIEDIPGYTVTYKSNEALNGTLPVDTNKYSANSYVQLKWTNVSKANYKLIGWSNVENATEIKYNFGQSVEITNDLVLYPVFEAKAQINLTYTTYEFTYGDNNINYALAGEDCGLTGYTISYYVDGSWITKAPKDAGTYNVRIIKDETSDKASLLKIVESGLVIKKAKINEPTVAAEIVYDGRTQAVVLNGLISGISTSDSMNQVNAGTYTIHFVLDANHEWADGQDGIITWTIEKAKVNEPTPTSICIYDGTPKTVVLNGVESYMSTTDSKTQTEVGVYTIHYTLDANHEWADGSDGIVTWYVNKPEIYTGTENEKGQSIIVVTTENGFEKEITVEVTVTVENEVNQKELTVDYYNIISNNRNVALKDNEAVSMIFDVKLFRTINGEKVEIQPSDIAPGTKIKVRMLLPESIDTTKLVRILHVHSAQDIETIVYDPNKLDDYGYYEIEVDRLSEFAVIYRIDDVNSEKDFTWLIILLIVIILIACVVATYFILKKKGINIVIETNKAVKDEAKAAKPEVKTNTASGETVVEVKLK